jgi:SAM-dependent methyltransferase
MNLCPMCNGKLEPTNGVIPDYFYSAKLELLDCSVCKLRTPITKTDIGDAYNEIYSSQDEGSYDRYHTYSKELVKKQNPMSSLQYFEPAYFAVAESLRESGLKPGARILEVGCGLGYLTYALNRSGFEIHGIDLSSHAVGLAKRIFGSELYTVSSLEEYGLEETYDCVVSTEVIEHVLDPDLFLRRISSLVKPGGHIILTTPNKTFFPDEVIWESSLPPVHYWWFTEKSIEIAAKRIGLKVTFVNFSKFFTGIRYLIWDKQNLGSVYQGRAQGGIIEENPSSKIKILKSTLRQSIQKIPILSSLIQRVAVILFHKKFLVASTRSHCMGVLLKKPLS